MAGSFSMDLSRFCKKYDADMKEVVRKIAFEAFKRVVLRTPVDTGRARANWGVTIGRMSGFTTAGTLNRKGEETFDKSGSGSLRSAMEGVNAWSTDGSIFLTNNLPYITALEYGHSGQAPNGMVRVTIEEMQAWIAANAAKQSIGDIRDNTGGR